MGPQGAIGAHGLVVGAPARGGPKSTSAEDSVAVFTRSALCYEILLRSPAQGLLAVFGLQLLTVVDGRGGLKDGRNLL